MILVIYKEELAYQKNREEICFLNKFDTSNNYLIISLDDITKNININEINDLNDIIKIYQKINDNITHLFFYPRQVKIINNDKIYKLIAEFPVKKTIYIDDLHHPDYNIDIINKFDYKLLPYHYTIKLMPKLNPVNIIKFPHYINDFYIKEPTQNRNIQVSVLGHYNKKPYAMRRLFINETNKVNEKLKFCKITAFKEEVPNSKYYEVLQNSFASIATSLDKRNYYFPYLVSKYFEIPGCGALLLAHVLPEFEEEMIRCGFIDNVNYIKFKTEDEFIEKCNYAFYPNNKEIIEKIRINGYELVKNNHLSSNRIHQIINLFS